MKGNSKTGVCFSGQYNGVIKEIRTQMVAKKVSKVLMRMEEEKIINKFGSTMSFTDDDLYGIDFIIYPVSGKKILIQVKTRYSTDQRQRYNKRNIYCLEVPYKKEESEIKSDILRILEKEKQKSEILKSTTNPRIRHILERTLL